jgi:hypothetical protein
MRDKAIAADPIIAPIFSGSYYYSDPQRIFPLLRSTPTYVWTINYTDILGNNKNRRGTLILVRGYYKFNKPIVNTNPNVCCCQSARLRNSAIYFIFSYVTRNTKHKIAISLLYIMLAALIGRLISHSHMGPCDPGAAIALFFYTPFIAGGAYIFAFIGRREGHSLFKRFAIINWVVLTAFVLVFTFSN